VDSSGFKALTFTRILMASYFPLKLFNLIEVSTRLDRALTSALLCAMILDLMTADQSRGESDGD
jgi:hypothetical protein